MDKAWKDRVLVSLVLVLAGLTIVTLLYSGKAEYVEHVKTLYNYEHRAYYDGVAYLKPNILYDNKSELGILEKPLYIPLVKGFNITFKYEVSGGEVLSGNYTSEIVLESPGKWSKLLSGPYNVTFDNNSLALSFNIDFERVNNITETIYSEVGVKSSTVNLKILSDISLEVLAGGRRLEDRITPNLIIELDYTTNMLKFEGVENIIPREKTLKTREWLVEDILGFKLEVSTIKKILYISLPTIATVFMGAFYLWKYRGRPKDLVLELEKKYKGLIVEAEGLQGGSKMRVKVRGLEELAKIASNVGKPIVAYNNPNSMERVYAVIVDDTMYYLEALIRG